MMTAAAFYALCPEYANNALYIIAANNTGVKYVASLHGDVYLEN
jgi:hypothetical protein